MRRGQIPLDGELDQAGDIVDIQLAHQAGAVGVDRFGAEFEAGGDLLGADPFHQQREHLVFAGAQRLQRVFGRGLVPAAKIR